MHSCMHTCFGVCAALICSRTPACMFSWVFFFFFFSFLHRSTYVFRLGASDRCVSGGGGGGVHVQLCHFSSFLTDLVDPAGYSRQTHTSRVRRPLGWSCLRRGVMSQQL